MIACVNLAQIIDFNTFKSTSLSKSIQLRKKSINLKTIKI